VIVFSLLPMHADSGTNKILKIEKTTMNRMKVNWNDKLVA